MWEIPRPLHCYRPSFVLSTNLRITGHYERVFKYKRMSQSILLGSLRLAFRRRKLLRSLRSGFEHGFCLCCRRQPEVALIDSMSIQLHALFAQVDERFSLFFVAGGIDADKVAVYDIMSDDPRSHGPEISFGGLVSLACRVAISDE